MTTAHTKVHEWLEKTGFPLEMAAAASFRHAGFFVRQSSTYPDPQTEKGREIDVLASDSDFLGDFETSFVIECKASKKPWVVLKSSDALAAYNRLFAFGVMTQPAREAIVKAWERGSPIKQYIQREDSGGYGLRQAFSEDADPAYSAAINVLKACHGLTIARRMPGVPEAKHVAFPVIVVDALLFECSLLDDGNLGLEEVPQSEFLFTAHVPMALGCCIRVVTKPHLDAFCEYAKSVAQALRNHVADIRTRTLPEDGSSI